MPLLTKIDHSNILQRISSWFGTSGIALKWIKSCHTSRSFYAHIKNSGSTVFQFLFGVLKDSVLGHLLFILFATHVSIVICKSPVHHHQYAEDTRSFISSSAEFPSNISIIENTITEDYSGFCKSFHIHLKLIHCLWIFLKKLSIANQPPILVHLGVSISPVASGRNLDSQFDSNLSLSDY
jgi:hypothetical protein